MTIATTPRRRAWIVIVATLAVYALLYAQTMGFAYVWDDIATLRDSPQFDRPLREALLVTQHGHISQELTQLQGIAPTHESYRPFLFLSFALDVSLFGKSSGAMHLHNILQGALAMLVAWRLARRLAGETACLFVAVVFALHPLHVEPFAYVSARADLMSGLLALVSALCVAETTDDSGEPRRPWTRGALTAVASLAFLLSLFAKEATIALPLALAAFAVAKGHLRAWRAPLVALVSTAMAVLLLRRAAAPGGVPIAPPIEMLRAVRDLPGITLEYVASFFVPVSLSIARPLHRGWVIAGWIAVGLCAGVAVVPSLRRRMTSSREHRLAVAGLVWAFLLVGPAAIAVVIMKVVADRYAFLPLFGIALSAGCVLDLALRRYGKHHRVIVGVAGAWVLALVLTTAAAIETWRDELSLYTRTVDVEPSSSIAHFGLGSLYAQQHRWSPAAVELEAATRLDDTNVLAFNNLGVVYLNLGRHDDAERALLHAIALMKGHNFRAWYNLGTLYRLRGDVARSCDALSNALAINPRYTKALEDAHRYCAATSR